MKNKRLVVPITIILIATILFFIPETILTTLIRVIGIIIIIFATNNIFTNIRNNYSPLELMYSIVMALIGVLLLAMPEVIASIFPLMIGLWMIASNLLKLKFVLSLKNNMNSNWIKLMIMNIVMILLGIILVFNPFKSAGLILRIVAIFMLAYGIMEIINYILSKPKKVKVIK